MSEQRYWERQAEVVEVDHAKRTIEVIVMPYEVEASVRYQERQVTEVICRGAFDGIERRPNRIKANRDHDETKTFGRAVAMHPGHQKGLHAEIRASQIPLGQETLQLCEDGCLEVSAGFLPSPGGMQWRSRDAYSITKAWLRHIAFVPLGAYGEDAGVLAVRWDVGEAPAGPAPTSSTPNLDQARLWLLERRVGFPQASR